MIETVRRVVTDRFRTAGFRECRRCGTTLDGAVDACPACGSGEIAHYSL